MVKQIISALAQVGFKGQRGAGHNRNQGEIGNKNNWKTQAKLPISLGIYIETFVSRNCSSALALWNLQNTPEFYPFPTPELPLTAHSLITCTPALESLSLLSWMFSCCLPWIGGSRLKTTSGNLGIGTTAPSGKFEVSNSTQGLRIDPNGGVSGGPIINSTGTTNVTITSSGGSVIIRFSCLN